MKGHIENLKNFFNDQEFYILSFYDYLNKKLVNSSFSFNEQDLLLFSEYFKKKDKSIFSKIWLHDSIQKSIFIFCEELYFHFRQENIISKKIFLEKLKLKVKNIMIRRILCEYYNELYDYYQIITKKSSTDNFYYYNDENFKIYYLKKVSEIRVSDFLNNFNLTYYIILDGLIKVDRDVFCENNVIYSSDPLLLGNFEMITENCSLIIFIIKKNFLHKLNWISEINKYGFFNITSSRIFSSIIYSETVTKENYIKLFQIASYLKEQAYQNEIQILDMKYFEYKKKMIHLINENIGYSEKKIMDILLQELGISSTKFYKIFSNLFLTSPHKYIDRVKIRQAYFLITEKKMKVESICEQLNYSIETFKKKFKIITGYTFLEFKRWYERG